MAMKQLHFANKFTTRDSLALEKYFNELSKQQMISADEEAELTRRYREGDIKALDKLVLANLRFVVSVAKQYEGLGMGFEDLISEGNIGLMKAAKRFDETKGYKFISYAVYWIRQTILKALNENARLIRLPYNQLASITKLQAAMSKLEQKYGGTPPDDRISEITGMDAKEIHNVLTIANKPAALDSPMSDEHGSAAFSDMLADKTLSSPDDNLLGDSGKLELERFINKLSDREATIIKLNFGLEGNDSCELKEIADRMNLGRERVRQIKVKALRKLRAMGNDNLYRVAV